jgi:cephalosporin hydroxylase
MMVCDECANRITSKRWWHCLECNANLCDDCKSKTTISASGHKNNHASVEYYVSSVITKDEHRQALLDCHKELTAKVARQGKVGSFFDYILHNFLKSAIATPNAQLIEEFFGTGPLSNQAAFLLNYLTRRKAGRFVDFFARKAMWGCDIPPLVFNMSQGVNECLQWKGRFLFKTVFDIGIYQALVAELRPKTIIEIGSGDGGSAIWFADLLQILEIEGRVYSLDIHALTTGDDRISFIQGDCNQIDTAFQDYPPENWPHPWLVIEDAHVNVLDVLGFFDKYLIGGDYLVVEDSLEKENILGRFLRARKDNYRVDTRYTDFFGQNATSSIDSIFRRM